MTNSYINSKKKSLTQRIADLIFLLNKVEKENPTVHKIYKKEVYFEYRLAQHQKVREIENA